ncbi:MAG: cytochrome, partial [Solirubrobacterales bacterium]|nr:cytochrome [Solirubrobacterales bacterium]
MSAARHVNPALAAQVRGLLAGATPATVPGGVLLWWGATELPDGGVLDQAAWEGAYVRLENGALAPGLVPPLPALLAATSAFRPDGELPIAIARFR